MAEYPGAARAAVSPNRSPRQGRVQLFIVHHYAGTQEPESAWRRFNAPNDRSVSPNYQVNADGSVFEVVPPDRFRAWTTGAIDHQAVTCETQNASGAPAWSITRESHEAIAHLIAWASQRYGFPIQRGAVADGNRVTRPGVVGHRETPAGRQTSTACPGPSMDLDWLVKRANEIVAGIPAGGEEIIEEKETDAMKIIGNGQGSQKFADEFGADDIGQYFFVPNGVDGNPSWVDNIRASWLLAGEPVQGDGWAMELARHQANARWDQKRGQIVGDVVASLKPLFAEIASAVAGIDPARFETLIEEGLANVVVPAPEWTDEQRDAFAKAAADEADRRERERLGDEVDPIAGA